jgi:type IX secretion system substrate protein
MKVLHDRLNMNTKRYISFLILATIFIAATNGAKANITVTRALGAAPSAVVQTMNAVVESQSIRISWNVSSLESIKSFEVQKAIVRNGSRNDVKWESIFVVDVSGMAKHTSEFAYHDMSARSGSPVVLYRIMSRMNDNSTIYSSTVQLKLIGSSNLELKSLYPNPVANGAASIVQYSVSSPEIVSIHVYDLSGKLVKTLVHSFHHIGEYNLSIATDALRAGRYFVRMSSPSTSNTATLMVTR